MDEITNKYTYRSLHAYKMAYKLSFDIFKLTKTFPHDEIYALTSQIRRSSRAIISNFVEGYRKRQYLKYFVSKLSDCDSECSETILWIEIAKDCGYISEDSFKYLLDQYSQLGSLLGYMIQNPEKYLPKKTVGSRR